MPILPLFLVLSLYCSAGFATETSLYQLMFVTRMQLSRVVARLSSPIGSIRERKALDALAGKGEHGAIAPRVFLTAYSWSFAVQRREWVAVRFDRRRAVVPRCG